MTRDHAEDRHAISEDRLMVRRLRHKPVMTAAAAEGFEHAASGHKSDHDVTVIGRGLRAHADEIAVADPGPRHAVAIHLKQVDGSGLLDPALRDEHSGGGHGPSSSAVLNPS